MKLSILLEFPEADVHQLHVLFLGQEGVFGGEEDSRDNRVLYETSDRLTRGRHDILLVGCHELVGLRGGLVRLRQMDVHPGIFHAAV